MSEPEVAAVGAELNALTASDVVLYMDVHSYSQFWLVPWGGQTAKPDDYSDLVRGTSC